MSAISSIIEAKEAEEIEKVIEDVVDPAGTFYRFSLPASMMRRKLL
jgi:F420-non-reducing hydrogenase small subunit